MAIQVAGTRRPRGGAQVCTDALARLIVHVCDIYVFGASSRCQRHAGNTCRPAAPVHKRLQGCTNASVSRCRLYMWCDDPWRQTAPLTPRRCRHRHPCRRLAHRGPRAAPSSPAAAVGFDPESRPIDGEIVNGRPGQQQPSAAASPAPQAAADPAAEPYTLLRRVRLAGGVLHLVSWEGHRLLRVWTPPGGWAGRRSQHSQTFVSLLAEPSSPAAACRLQPHHCGGGPVPTPAAPRRPKRV